MLLHSQPFSLEPVAPFDFEKSLAFLAQARAMAAENEVDGGTLTKALRIGGETVGVRVRSVGEVAKPRLEGLLYAAVPLAPDLVEAALQRFPLLAHITTSMSEPALDVTEGDKREGFANSLC